MVLSKLKSTSRAFFASAGKLSMEVIMRMLRMEAVQKGS
ncbi:hypothetical protein [Thalassospira alkalitolerans]